MKHTKLSISSPDDPKNNHIDQPIENGLFETLLSRSAMYDCDVCNVSEDSFQFSPFEYANLKPRHIDQ